MEEPELRVVGPSPAQAAEGNPDLGLLVPSDSGQGNRHNGPAEAARHRGAVTALVIAFLLLQRYWRSGLTAGSVK